MRIETIVEQNCIIEHNGQNYEAMGAIVSPERLIAYIGKPLRNNYYGEPETTENFKYPHYEVTDWHGNRIGKCQVTSRWLTGRLFRTMMFSVIITLDNGLFYKGRTQGQGMIVKAKISKKTD